MPERDFDLIVIGSGPGGQKAAIQASKLGRRVAVIERRERVGGVSIHTGTVPSKTLREAVLELLKRRNIEMMTSGGPNEEWEMVGAAYLRDRAARVVAAEATVVRDQFRRNRVTLLYGQASFVDPHTVEVRDGRATAPRYTADEVIVAVGTVPARPAGIPFDERRVLDSDGILEIHARVPRTMTVVGAGVIGVEYASIFAALGTRVTLVDQRPGLLSFADGEITEALQYLLRRRGVTFRFGEAVTGVERHGDLVMTTLQSGKRIPSDMVLYAIGRQGATDRLALDRAGLEPDRRGPIETDQCGRTAVEHIYAVGDVAGPPGLAATAFEEGRVAALVACGEEVNPMPELVPTCVYAIPELAMVGRTEEELTEASVPYVTGVARWNELARGLISGDEDGMLKILVSTEDRSLLGVHVLGTGAGDLVHVGQALLLRPAALDFLVSAVFNYPTFAESYKVAALDAMNRMRVLGLVDAAEEAAASPVPDAASNGHDRDVPMFVQRGGD
jgi:NAD(P) transhydrogenase